MKIEFFTKEKDKDIEFEHILKVYVNNKSLLSYLKDKYHLVESQSLILLKKELHDLKCVAIFYYTHQISKINFGVMNGEYIAPVDIVMIKSYLEFINDIITMLEEIDFAYEDLYVRYYTYKDEVE